MVSTINKALLLCLRHHDSKGAHQLGPAFDFLLFPEFLSLHLSDELVVFLQVLVFFAGQTRHPPLIQHLPRLKPGIVDVRHVNRAVEDVVTW